MKVFGDFHIHIGRAGNGKPIKITASKDLTFANIVYEAANKKGLNMIGIIDCHSPYVQEDIIKFLEEDRAYEQKEGGIIYEDKICVLLGAEVETIYKKENGIGCAHNICFFKYLKDIMAFSKELSNYLKNITLSTQHTSLTGYELYNLASKYNGILIPAHIFTPFKSYYGNCTDRLEKIFKENYDKITAVELGLSADTNYADMIRELDKKVFLTNSDAHSLPKIAREYNELELENISFESFKKAVTSNDDKKNYIVKNYGMNPKLGKYNRTYCDGCSSLSEIVVVDRKLKSGKVKKENICKKCGSKKIAKGVEDRIMEIADGKSISPKNRPEYIYQIPIEFIPGIGKKTFEKILDLYGTEMNVLHNVTYESLEKQLGKDIAKNIIEAREGRLKISSGGGGNYGKIDKTKKI